MIVPFAVIDSGLLEAEIAVLLQKIEQEKLQLGCLVFVDTTRQRETFLAMGVDAVILHNEPVECLAQVLNNMKL